MESSDNTMQGKPENLNLQKVLDVWKIRYLT
jgi:hypothetical protein